MTFRLSFLSSVSLALLIAACSRWQTASYATTWAYAARGPCPEETRNIVFSFVRYRHYSYGICSRDLGSYLDSLHSHLVSVEFAVLDLPVKGGGAKPIKIGEKTKWNSEFEYESHTESSSDVPSPALDSSPWDKVRQHR